MKRAKLGLALSGGGACGAYEVGALKALAQIGLEPRVIAGSSIGALNGAVVASFRLSMAAARLEKTWRELRPEKVLQPRRPRLPKKNPSPPALRLFRRRAPGVPVTGTAGEFYSRLRDLLTNGNKTFALFEDGPLDSIIGAAIDFKRLYRGKQFYVSVFPASQGLTGAFADLLHWLLSRRKSEFFLLQSLSPEKILTILKASAAIPLVFPAQEINGRIYRDGSLGGRTNAQGNIPVEPLVAAGCTHIIAVILESGVRLDKNAWPGIKLVALRPSRPILHMGDIKAMLDFSPGRIQELISLGEKDTLQNRELLELKRALHPIKSRWDRLKEAVHKSRR